MLWVVTGDNAMGCQRRQCYGKIIVAVDCVHRESSLVVMFVVTLLWTELSHWPQLLDPHSPSPLGVGPVSF